MTTENKVHWWTKITRDLILFVVGLALTINEAFFYDGPERTNLLILYAGMMGLPFVLRYEELRRKDDGK